MKFFIIGIIGIVCIFFSCVEEPVDEFDSIRIINPKNYQSFYTRDMPISLDGKASSTFKNLSRKIRWTSNISGELGSGSSIYVTLEPGEHVIKAVCPFTYEDYTASVKITVEDYTLGELKTKTNLSIKVKDQDGDILIVNKGKGIITDTSTGLMWERNPDSYQYTYNEALSLAQNSKLAGYTNWRLPTIKELSDICNLYTDGRDAALHPEFISREGDFWTSTTVIDVKKEFFNDAVGTFKYTISQIDAITLTDKRLLSKKSYVGVNSAVYVRLVRNLK